MEDNFDMLPEYVQDIFNSCSGDEDYEDCKKLVEELNLIGWTAEYGLDAIIFNIRKI